MNYALINQVIGLVENFEMQRQDTCEYSEDLEGFKRWMFDAYKEKSTKNEPNWEGKNMGRSPESVISTLLVHLNRYARTYSKAAIWNSDFTTQDEFIFLINLKVFGAMSKMEVIKKNIQDKPAGMKIIHRLIEKGWVEQHHSSADKRSKLLQITIPGMLALDNQMDKIRQASQIVCGDITHAEKMDLIRLLHKLDIFHQQIYQQQWSASELLDKVKSEYFSSTPSMS
jgi:DNA-binding MarR family transcriptional regulator